MNKRPGFIVVVIIFVIAIVGFYIFLKKQQAVGVTPISAVPVNSAIIIEVKKPQKFYSEITEKSIFLRNLNQLTEVSNFISDLSVVDSLVNADIKLKKLLSQNSVLISMHEVGNKEYYPLYVIRISGRFEANQILKSIENSWSNGNLITSERYNQAKLYKVKNGSNQFFYSYHNGLLMASRSEILLEDAIRQSESETNLLSDTSLEQLMKTSGNNARANIYIQFKYFQQFLNKVVSESFLAKHSLNQMGDWIELDLNLRNQTLLFNGFAIANADDNRFMNIFRGQTPQNIKFLKFLPAGSEGFMGFGLSNYRLFKQNLQKYMEQVGEIDRYNVNHKKVREILGGNAEDELEIIFKNELVQVSLPDNSTLFYIKIDGFRSATELINKWLNNYCKANNKGITEYKRDYTIDNESVFPIYKMPIDYLPARLFGPWFKSSKAQYVTVFGDYLIFGDSYNVVSKTIYNNVLQKTLAYDGAFTQFADYLSTKVNYFGYISLSGTGNILESRMNGNAFKFYKQNQEFFRDYYALAWQFSLENNLYYNNLLFRYQPSNEIKAATEWETRLDTIIAFKPQMVKNHYTKEKEIFVQDEKSNIYLINRSGRVLWKKHIDEAIMGEVFQVDYYKNGKLQFLFNTKSRIYLLDRNGNFVERYPINLPSKAVAPMAIFDYDKKNNYRLFVPLVNNKVKVYSIEGKSVSGFKFKGADKNIIAPIQYFRNKNRDYIIVTDESRIYILDRKGNRRIKLQKQFKASKNNVFEYQPGNSTRPSRLVRSDINGTVYYIYFDGKVEQKQILECSPNHYFNVTDVSGDRINDFVFIDKDKLSVYSLTGKKLFDHKFSTTIKHNPSFYRFSSNKTYVGVTEVDARKIYLFDTKGNILNGFPLVGKTRFSIGFLDSGSGRFNLVVGGDEYYLYNFKLN